MFFDFWSVMFAQWFLDYQGKILFLFENVVLEEIVYFSIDSNIQFIYKNVARLETNKLPISFLQVDLGIHI